MGSRPVDWTDRVADAAVNVTAGMADRLAPLVARVPGVAAATAWFIRVEQAARLNLDWQRRALAEYYGFTPSSEAARLREQLEALGAELDPARAARSRRHRPPVHWRESGSGPALLLLNGWSMSGLVWPADFVRRLERDFRVIRPDNRGTGWSRSAPIPFTIADLADDAAQVLRAARAGSATVVGISMGGMVAQELALRHPDLVDHLVLIATQPPRPAEVAAGSGLMGPSLRAPGEGSTGAWFRELFSEYCAPGFAETHPELMDELVDQVLQRPAPRRVLFEQVRAMSAWRGPNRLRRISVPTTVVHGDVDPVVPVANGMRVAQLIAGARYVELAGIGHLPPVEAPDRLADVVVESARPSPVGSRP